MGLPCANEVNPARIQNIVPDATSRTFVYAAENRQTRYIEGYSLLAYTSSYPYSAFKLFGNLDWCLSARSFSPAPFRLL
jgi:hypothetical protein